MPVELEDLLDGTSLERSGATFRRAALTGDVTATAGSNATTIANDAVTTAKILNDNVTYAKIQNVSATDRLLGRDTASAGDIEEITVGGGIEFTGSTGIQRSALTGDVTATAGSNATTIANDAVTTAKILNANVTLAKMADLAQSTIIGRAAGAGTGVPTALSKSQSQAILGIGTTTLGIVIDGGGSAIATGIKGDLRIPFACTITKATLLADQSGSIVVDVWKDTYANYPPTDADSITSAAPPTISTATKSEDATLTGWTTSIAAGDILRFNVDSATTVERVVLQLDVTY